MMVLVAIGWQVALNRSYDQGRRIAAQRRVESPVVPVPATPAPVAGSTQEVEQRLGPFSLAGNSYSVVLRQKPRAPGAAQETGKTVESMEIRDSNEGVLYKRAFRSRSEPDIYSDAWYVTAHLMTHGGGTGLMLNYSVDGEPSAPTPEETTWWQLFGVVDGMLRPFTGPLAVQGDLLDSHFDTFDFRVWAHHASLIFPVHVDWVQGRLFPDQNCVVTPCQFRAIPKESRPREGLTFARLCPNPTKCDNPERIVVKKDSAIEVLACNTPVRWKEGNALGESGQNNGLMDGEGEISVPEGAVWLKIGIDGKEGWVHDKEDLASLGMIFEQ
jgi:hypothetical protein